jgi:hypothetical protein
VPLLTEQRLARRLGVGRAQLRDQTSESSLKLLEATHLQPPSASTSSPVCEPGGVAQRAPPLRRHAQARPVSVRHGPDVPRYRCRVWRFRCRRGGSTRPAAPWSRLAARWRRQAALARYVSSCESIGVTVSTHTAALRSACRTTASSTPSSGPIGRSRQAASRSV